MEKKRVYQVAKDFHVSSEALVSMLRELHYEVKSHMSVVDDKMFKSIKEQFKKQHAEAVKDIQKKKKISEAISEDIGSKKPFQKAKKEKAKEKISPKKAKQPPKHVPEKKAKSTKKQRDHERKSRSRARKQRLKEHQEAVQDSFKKTMASISSDSKTKSKKSRSRHSDGNFRAMHLSRECCPYWHIKEFAFDFFRF